MLGFVRRLSTSLCVRCTRNCTMSNQARSKRPWSAFCKDVRLRNKAEDTNLQQTLDLIDRRRRVIVSALSRERDSLVKDHEKLLHLKVCEPRATVDNTMREISETKKVTLGLWHSSPTHLTSQQNRQHSCKSPPYGKAKPVLTSRRSKSAHHFQTNSRGDSRSHTMTKKEHNQKTSLQRPKSTVMVSTGEALESKGQLLSIMQLKNMATIDSISEKELVSQQEYVRQEKERLKLLLREKLNKKIQTFLRKLDVQEMNTATETLDKSRTSSTPYRNLGCTAEKTW